MKHALASSDMRTTAGQRYCVRVILFAIAVVLALGPLGILAEALTANGTLTKLDMAPARSLHPVVVGSPGLVDVLEVVSFFGSPPWFYVVLGGSALYLWLKKRRGLASFIVVTGLVGGVVDTAVKLWVDRPRPSLAHPVAIGPRGSFPSGHTMTATIGYGVLLLVFLPLVARRLRVAMVIGTGVLVCIIGCARLALGVHFVSDVVGGFLLGLAWLAASTTAFSMWRRDQGKAPVKPLEGVDPDSVRTL
jgi:membrane-associated phospholipid phosphatase